MKDFFDSGIKLQNACKGKGRGLKYINVLDNTEL